MPLGVGSTLENWYRQLVGQPVNYAEGEDITDADLNAERSILGAAAPIPAPAPSRFAWMRGGQGRIRKAIGAAPDTGPSYDYSDVELPSVRGPQLQDLPDPSRPAPTPIEAAAEPPIAAAPASPRTRAIRMPDGRLLYTNRAELPGNEIPMAQAVQQERTERASIDPTSATMSALVRASARANRQTPPTAAPMLDSPAVSVMEGTPQQRMSMSIDDAVAAATLAQIQQATAEAKLSPQERSDLDNPGVGRISYLNQLFAGDIAKENKTADLAIGMAKRQFPAGPALDSAIARIEDDRSSRLNGIYARMAALQGGVSVRQ